MLRLSVDAGPAWFMVSQWSGQGAVQWAASAKIAENSGSGGAAMSKEALMGHGVHFGATRQLPRLAIL